MYGGGCIILEQANLQGLWTHLNRLVMKNQTPEAQQVVSCIVLIGSSQLEKLEEVFAIGLNSIFSVLKLE